MAGDGGRASAHLVAAVLVEHYQEDGHGHDDADHDEGVEHRVEEALAHGGRVLGERRVDADGEGKAPVCSLARVGGPWGAPPLLQGSATPTAPQHPGFLAP